MHSFDEYKKIINDNLSRYIPEVDSYASKIKDSMIYSLNAGGKRLRPVLLLASCDFAGGNINEAIPFACAIEYIHTYSLIHDDLPAMDNDDLRRGKPTNHKVYGEDIAILAGDALLNTAAEIVFNELNSKSNNISNMQKYARIGQIFMSCAGIEGMIGGQVADVENEYKECTPELLEYIEENKTGKLILASISSGILLSNNSEKYLNDFTKFANNLGVAFQISDDILDFEGNSNDLGKAVWKDRELGKCNYACVHGLENAKLKLNELIAEAKKSISKFGDKVEFFNEISDLILNRNK